MARDALESALHVAVEIGDRLMEGWTLCKLADCLRGIGDEREAIAMYEKALDIAAS